MIRRAFYRYNYHTQRHRIYVDCNNANNSSRSYSVSLISCLHHDEITVSKVRIKKNHLDTTLEEPPLHLSARKAFDGQSMDSPISPLAAGAKAAHATKVGAVANLGLAVSKATVGFSISSTALIADAANSMGDLLSDAVVYYSVTEARKKATPDRPWGRGKAEPLGALSVGSLLIVTATGIGYAGLISAIDIAAATHIIPQHYADIMLSGDLFNYIMQYISNGGNMDIAGTPSGDTVLYNHSIIDPNTTQSLTDVDKIADSSSNDVDGSTFQLSPQELAALGVSGMSIAAKEALFRYTLKAGTEANSDAVIANAWQHRADVNISFAVFAGLIGRLCGYPIFDPLAGLLVSGLIAREGLRTVFQSLKDLGDAPASATETEMLKQTCLSVSGVITVEELRARKSGPYLYVEVIVGVDGNISASAAHRLSELTRQELLLKHIDRVAHVVVDVTPLGSSGLGEQSPHWARDHDFIVDEIKNAAKLVEEVIYVSEVQVYYKDNGEIAAKLDIVLHRNWTIKQAHWIAVKTRRQIEVSLPGLTDIDVDLELEEDDSDSSDSESDDEEELPPPPPVIADNNDSNNTGNNNYATNIGSNDDNSNNKLINKDTNNIESTTSNNKSM